MNPARLSVIAVLVLAAWTPYPLGQHTDEAEITVVINTLPPVHWAYPDLDSIKLKTAEGNMLQPHLDLERSRAIRYRPTDQGPFTLTIDDPRFEAIVISGIVPSQKPVSANLVGRSAIRLRVFEGENGSEIKSWSAAIRLENTSYPSSKEPWDVASIWSKAEPAAMHERTDVFELPGEARDANGWFHGIPPGDYTLIVQSLSHGASYVACPALVPGEKRDLEVPMWPPCAIDGVVEGVSPFERGHGLPIEVFAFVPGEEDAAPPGITFGSAIPVEYRGFRLARATGSVDEQGRFRLDGLAPGIYLLQARQKGVRRDLPDGPFAIVASPSTATALSPGAQVQTTIRWIR